MKEVNNNINYTNKTLLHVEYIGLHNHINISLRILDRYTREYQRNTDTWSGYT